MCDLQKVLVLQASGREEDLLRQMSFPRTFVFSWAVARRRVLSWNDLWSDMV